VNITITGASGLIGRRLLKNLGGNGHTLTVVSRHAGTNVPPGVAVAAWDPMKGPAPEDCVRNAAAVIHLAGEPVAQRWNTDARRRIRESRVVGTRNLVQALAKLRNPPRTLICASAVGYYGSRGDAILSESAVASGVRRNSSSTLTAYPIASTLMTAIVQYGSPSNFNCGIASSHGACSFWPAWPVSSDTTRKRSRRSLRLASQAW